MLCLLRTTKPAINLVTAISSGLPSYIIKQSPCLLNHTIKQSSVLYMSTKRRQFRPRHDWDDVDRRSELIYMNSMSYSLYTSMGVTAATAYPTFALSLWTLFSSWDQLPEALFDLQQPVTPALVMGTAGLILVEMVRRVFWPGVSRIYFNRETEVYTVVPLRTLPKRPNLEFTAGELRQKDVSGLFKEMTGNYVVKGRSLYIVSKDFKHPSFFNRLTEEITRDKFLDH